MQGYFSSRKSLSLQIRLADRGTSQWKCSKNFTTQSNNVRVPFSEYFTRPPNRASAFKRTQKELNWKSVGKRDDCKKGSNVFTVGCIHTGILGVFTSLPDPPENCFAPMCREMQRILQVARSDQTGKKNSLAPNRKKNITKTRTKKDTTKFSRKIRVSLFVGSTFLTSFFSAGTRVVKI